MKPTYDQLVAALKTSHDLLLEAIEVHVYGPDDSPDLDCPYHAAVMHNATLLGGLGIVGNVTGEEDEPSALDMLKQAREAYLNGDKALLQGILAGDIVSELVEAGSASLPAHTRTATRAAIVAGLRMLMNALDNGDVTPNDGDIGDILTCSGAHDALTASEVDELCAELLS